MLFRLIGPIRPHGVWVATRTAISARREATRSLTLAEWARQLGKSDIIPEQGAAELRAEPRGQVAADLATRGGVDPSGNDSAGGHGDGHDEGRLEVEADEGGDHGGRQQESSAMPHSEEMFVEELRVSALSVVPAVRAGAGGPADAYPAVS